MRLFRRGSKKQDMAAKESADRDWPEELGAEGQGQKVRVNDRRRVRLGDEPAGEGGEESAASEQQQPSLKPSYVEELEARARAAEQKSSDVQARFEQVRADLKR